MIASLAALLLAAASASQPSTQAAAPAPAAGQPKRIVTYHVTQGTRTYSAGEHYEGFSSSSSAKSDQGTVSVSVLSVSGDSLDVSVTETMNSTGRPATYTGTVAADGTVMFPADTVQDVTRELLTYLGPQIEPTNQLTQGSSWDANLNRNGVDLATHYKVTKVDGDLVTLSVHQTIKVAAQNVTVSMDGNIVMKPSLLVAVSGDVHRTVHRTTVSGDTQTTISLQFQRLSDTLDPQAH